VDKPFFLLVLEVSMPRWAFGQVIMAVCLWSYLGGLVTDFRRRTVRRGGLAPSRSGEQLQGDPTLSYRSMAWIADCVLVERKNTWIDNCA
jgi:hypothetical protein